MSITPHVEKIFHNHMKFCLLVYANCVILHNTTAHQFSLAESLFNMMCYSRYNEYYYCCKTTHGRAGYLGLHAVRFPDGQSSSYWSNTCLDMSGRIKRMNDRMCETQDLVNFLRERNAKQADAIIRLTAENKRMASLLNCFQGPNIPGNTRYNGDRQKWRKGRAADPEPKKTGCCGSRDGRVGVSHRNKPARKVYHRLVRCPHCGGSSFKTGGGGVAPYPRWWPILQAVPCGWCL